MKRTHIITTIVTIIIATLLSPLKGIAVEEQSIIIEVDGDPAQQKEYIENHYPYIEVVQVYDTIFTGLALKGSPSNLQRMGSMEFVKKAYPVRTYETNTEANPNKSIPFLMEEKYQQKNSTDYTGEGVKIGVIDTGVDYRHPDLKKNYKGGYDLVDLDDDPLETQPEQGIPTMHGTHVSGIIAADGNMKGIAPDADLYGYRALGPGGRGTSIQVIAAIEKAVKDGMDIINMSLGNSVNGPDWPTSIAVNKAIKLGVSVVIANGNAGPSNWTVGSPATATNAISVGASTPPLEIPFLYDSFEDKQIIMSPLLGSKPWNLQKDYPITYEGIGNKEITGARGKIVLLQRGKVPFAEKARKAEQAGAEAVIIFNNEEGPFQGSVSDGKGEITIPVAAISQKDGQWLKQQANQSKYWIDTKYKKTKDQIAGFSSRGPVTANWHIKPEIVAPGAAIMSTVPGGYQELQGTSMASPHVAGGLALVKQAHPDWTPAQLKGALLTSALPLTKGEQLYDPIDQGMGRMQPDKAIETDLIITNPLLAFGKVEKLKEKHSVQMQLENVSDQEKTYYFEVPEQKQGLRWYFPKSFTLKPGEKKTVEVELAITSSGLDTGIHQGWITLNQGSKSYKLPYLFLNKDGEFPKAMGMEFSLKQFSDDQYQYRLYLPEKTEQVTVDLYDPNSLSFERTLLELEDLAQGIIEGSMEKRDIGKQGEYLANISIETKDGKIHHYQTTLQIAFPE
ncbi:S8 family serine peptidase [Aquibacillus kalidii]|uniref:S8 family serine peptidase n=1 Tax=Aquibacillus kalidii TaxID=2762597 RepID=UPI002E2B123B|nr:S8 family serine peptidase [Aquibacillus kalidii]